MFTTIKIVLISRLKGYEQVIVLYHFPQKHKILENIELFKIAVLYTGCEKYTSLTYCKKKIKKKSQIFNGTPSIFLCF